LMSSPPLRAARFSGGALLMPARIPAGPASRGRQHALVALAPEPTLTATKGDGLHGADDSGRALRDQAKESTGALARSAAPTMQRVAEYRRSVQRLVVMRGRAQPPTGRPRGWFGNSFPPGSSWRIRDDRARARPFGACRAFTSLEHLPKGVCL
jgi:hypothetical protein